MKAHLHMMRIFCYLMTHKEKDPNIESRKKLGSGGAYLW